MPKKRTPIKRPSVQTKALVPKVEASGELEESMEAAAAREMYFLLPERSLSKLVTAMGKLPSYITQLKVWSAKYGWVKQAIEYDRKQAALIAKELRRKRAAELDAMNEYQSGIAKGFLAKASNLLNEQLEKKELKPNETITLIHRMVEIERMARGAATTRSEIAAEVDQNTTIVINTEWGTGAIDKDEREDEG